MENDSIRPSGTDTLVDIWVDGKLRAICITRAAIETFADFNASLGSSSEDDRCEFVRGHLSQIVAAVQNRLRGANPAADTVVIDAGDLGAARERRKGDRRKGDRRKGGPGDLPPHGERRRGERRKSQRRQSPEGSKS